MAYTQAIAEHKSTASGLDKIVLKSSFLSAASYDLASQALTLTFKTGYTAVHEQVPVGVWETFKLAPSAGRYYARVLKTQYPAVPTHQTLKVSDLERAQKDFNPNADQH